MMGLSAGDGLYSARTYITTALLWAGASIWAVMLVIRRVSDIESLLVSSRFPVRLTTNSWLALLGSTAPGTTGSNQTVPKIPRASGVRQDAHRNVRGHPVGMQSLVLP